MNVKQVIGKFDKRHTELVELYKKTSQAARKATDPEMADYLFNKANELIGLAGATTKAMMDAASLRYTTKGDFTHLGGNSLHFRG